MARTVERRGPSPWSSDHVSAVAAPPAIVALIVYCTLPTSGSIAVIATVVANSCKTTVALNARHTRDRNTAMPHSRVPVTATSHAYADGQTERMATSDQPSAA